MASVFPQGSLEIESIRRDLPHIRIIGTGSYAASQEVTNQDLAQFGFDPDWIEQRTGILSRRHAPEEHATSDLALEAALKCISSSEISAEDIDLIIVATMTPDYFTPSVSCILQAKLGCQAAAFDLNAACSGFMYGMITASQFLHSGCARNCLVIGADKMSIVVDERDVKTFPLFGDGAGAVLLTRDQPETEDPAEEAFLPKGILAYRMASVGELGQALVVPGGCSRKPASPQVLANRENYLKMDGKPVFKWAVRLIPEVITQLLADAHLTADDLDLVILHQANRRILDAAIENTSIDPSKFFVNLDRYGNTSAASIPVALDEARQQDLIQEGNKVLLLGFGAGLSWGACIYHF